MNSSMLVFIPMRKYRAGSGASMEEHSVIVGADTLFGAFCWAYSMIYGGDDCRALVNQFVKRDPPFLISSMFPAKRVKGRLTALIPIPRVPGLRERIVSVAEREIKDRSKAVKIAGSVELGTVSAVESLTRGELQDLVVPARRAVLATKSDVQTLPDFASAKEYRNSLDRVTMESELFRTSMVLMSEGSGLAFWVRYRERRREIEACLRAVCELGVGGERSLGFGVAEGEPGFYEEGPPSVGEAATSFMTLSPYSPTREEAVVFARARGSAYYSLQERAAFYAGLGRVRYFCFGEGSVFPSLADSVLYGRMVGVGDGVYRYGFAFHVALGW